ncbi:tRNA (uracil-5-)-methyltransferase homolog B [Microcaecilia unicolor]|uniref:tRNA (uracil(54)-C(5))-methyltransferase n=1 Tax=Microcaecilia unicolor TaxID=1415580 RepID=A0A6P7YED0_9AMPH|nr:tRNA (uracil(54)-C(5))-methyltransferase homolog [Microcaecilia unicolor]XP_030065793.1 tRNA (uracil(54)-C(5))-methyltransferase homolog [Microcaecilia unicolor]XP_030065794.1 tRNA (uracil(54)-C(5))-methyltransferase homolog [Microcaecilia unicolor]
MALSSCLRLVCQNVGQPLKIRQVFSGVTSDKVVSLTTKKSGHDKSRKKQRRKISYQLDPDLSWEERLLDVVTPLWRLDYEEQLKKKFVEQKNVLQKLSSQLKELSKDQVESSQTPEELCCPLHPVVPSPVINGYRNKSTFSVNRGPDGDPKTVGHYVGRYRKGMRLHIPPFSKNIVCVRSHHLLNMPEKHYQVAQCYEEMIHQSPLNSCLLFHDGGHWREITVRTNREGHTMAIIIFHPQELSQEELCAQKESVKEFFTRGPGAECNLTSLYFQESSMTRCTHEQSPYQLLYGEPHIFEEILGLKFRISPDAFFQVNTAGAEALYRTVQELIQVEGNMVLFDICCGTGAIGLSMARHVSRVFGIELVEQAVDDAKWNASFNGISNCQFYSGKAEVVLPQLLSSLKEERSLTAVVNPSRAGLHYRVIWAIRKCKLIRTLVYVSCKPDGEAMRNFIELCCPPNDQKKIFGEPFVLMQAIPIDMFPHTPHCELVLLFRR